MRHSVERGTGADLPRTSNPKFCVCKIMHTQSPEPLELLSQTPTVILMKISAYYAMQRERRNLLQTLKSQSIPITAGRTGRLCQLI